MQKTPLLAGATLALALVASQSAFAMSDKAFLKQAIQGDTSEIMLGKLAEKQGHSQAVQNYGQMLVTDHSAARQKTEALAKKEGVTPPKGAKAEASKEMKKLQGMSGTAFDKELISFAVKDHNKAIAMYQQEAKKGKGPVSQLAETTLPTLEKHLKDAKSIGGM